MELEKLFQNFIKYAESKHLLIEGIAVADDKKVILEHHFTPDLARNIYSHTKSYMSTAAGIAISQGKLSLDDKLTDFFPEYVPEHPDTRLFKISLKNLLTMSSGFGNPYLMGGDRRSGVGFPDYLSYMMNRPMEKDPAESFLYSTSDSILAGRMIEKAVGQRLGEYLYHQVFSKLEQGWPMWENDPMGHPIGGGGMFMKLTDMMKLGQLYLADGVWKGERIVESDWIKEATSKQIDTPPDSKEDIWRCGYGYQFWLSPYPDAYRADGAFGQITTVFPRKGMVVSVQCPEYGDFDKVKGALHEQLFANL
ncbi:MAG: serine hydrolase [Lachnospiraceae bacterium]|nr:serine hydrolase [Lachnospiraceae bacterium]